MILIYPRGRYIGEYFFLFTHGNMQCFICPINNSEPTICQIPDWIGRRPLNRNKFFAEKKIITCLVVVVSSGRYSMTRIIE